jgi:hypothetical protein
MPTLNKNSNLHNTLECMEKGISWNHFTKYIHIKILGFQYITNILLKAMIPFEFHMSPKHNMILLIPF